VKLEELKKIAAARTKGEWKCSRHTTVDGIGEYDYFSSPHGRELWNGGPKAVMYFLDDHYKKDREFIATAANTYDDLIEIAEAAERFEKAIGQKMPSSYPEFFKAEYECVKERRELRVALSKLTSGGEG
jgi:hypothetical protein